MTDLLSCPFCGVAPVLVDARLRFLVRCMSCQLVGPLSRWHGEFDKDDAGPPTDVDVTIWKEEAVNLWNTRATRPTPSDAMLREALEKIAALPHDDDGSGGDAAIAIAYNALHAGVRPVAAKRPGFQVCPTCGGEFDEGEWNASNQCPECETPSIDAALASPAVEVSEDSL